MNNPEVSVLICVHNPDLSRLARVLAALASQTLSRDAWELIVVDNVSDAAIKNVVDLSWHSNARVVNEARLGLTWARLKAMESSRSDLLVYVDDDNVLSDDYLETALNLARQWPILGAWGGTIVAEFEEEPAVELQPYLGLLALLDVKHDSWCNFQTPLCIPRGAGLVVRKSVAFAYAAIVRSDVLRHKLERQGTSLASCGDTDLCFTAFSLGLGVGLFSRLSLTHLIPRNRVSRSYLLALQESMSYSWTILNALYGRKSVAKQSTLKRIVEYVRGKLLAPADRDFYFATERGRRIASQHLRKCPPKTADE